MGRFILLSLPAMATMLAPTVAAAQQGQTLREFQLDPARDPNRPQVEGPEVDNRPRLRLPGVEQPTIEQPPVLANPPPETQPPVDSSQPQQGPQAAAQQRPEPRPTTTPTPETRRSEAPPPAQATETQPSVQAPADGSADEALNVAGDAAPAEAANTLVSPPPITSDLPLAPPADRDGGGWPWAAVVALMAAAVGLFLILRRHPRKYEAPVEPVDATPPTDSAAVEPAPEDQSSLPRPPGIPIAVAKAPAPAARLSLQFEVLEARTSIVAVTIAYRLMIRNEGALDAQDVVVAAVMANAEAKQEQTLARFFATPGDAPSHQVGRIGAGDWVEMKGELRLDHNAITPIRVQDKALFIPVLAFTAHYGWAEGRRGYSAAAFIVGQESDPPQERMAPLRLDLGPRQFRSIGSRVGQSALVT